MGTQSWFNLGERRCVRYRHITLGLVFTSLALLSACGDSSPLVAAPGTTTTAPPTPYVPGTGFWELDRTALTQMSQPNAATASIALDGSSTVLVMATPATAPSAAGRYVGGGTGNKVVIGLEGFDGLKLADLGTVELDAKLVGGGTSNFYMNFLVDLDCSKDEDLSVLSIAQLRERRRIIVWIPGVGVLQADGYSRYSVAATDAQWLIVGSPSLGMGVNPSGPATALGLTGFPNACIVDGVSADGGLLRNQSIPACVSAAALPTSALAQCGLPHMGAMVLLGDSVNTLAKEWRVQRVKIKDRVVTMH